MESKPPRIPTTDAMLPNASNGLFCCCGGCGAGGPSRAGSAGAAADDRLRAGVVAAGAWPAWLEAADPSRVTAREIKMTQIPVRRYIFLIV